MKHVELEYNGLDYCMDQANEKLYKIGITDKDGFEAGRGVAYVDDFSFNGGIAKGMMLGGVWTAVAYRRLGMARKTFQMFDDVVRETGTLVSYLHPFSFPYYRTIGYERVADHRVLEFEMTALDFLPRYAQMEQIRPGDSAADLDAVHNKFAKNRNVTLFRHGSIIGEDKFFSAQYLFDKPFQYSLKGKECHLCRDEQGNPDGYIITRLQAPVRDH